MNDITERGSGPTLEQIERPQSEGKRWAILLGFAALATIAVLGINHNNDAPAAPPATSAAALPATSAAAPGPVTPPTTPPRQGG